MKVEMAKKKAKAKAKAKVAKKVAEKLGKGAKASAALAALLAVAAGCATTGPQPARSQSQVNEFDRCVVIVGATAATVSNGVVVASTESGAGTELFTQTQANEGSETISPTASPTNTTDTDAALDVPVNRGNSGTSAASGVVEAGISAAKSIKDLFGGSSATNATATATCSGGTCTNCTPSATCANCED